MTRARAPLRIAVAGAGPAGLYFACLLKSREPAHEITVWEREPRGRTYGFGVLFSDLALRDLELLDTVLHAAFVRDAVHWDDIEICYRGSTTSCTGHGFAALPRHRLLELLAERCEEAGVHLRYDSTAPDPAALGEHDLLVAADGAGSTVRARQADRFGSSVAEGRCGFMWLGARLGLKAFKFHILETKWGVFQLHCYPHAAGECTVVAEARQEVWAAAGLDEPDPDPDRLQELFGPALGGVRLLARPGSRRQVFRTVTNARWHHGSTVLIGDAAHTAHFSIGSGTKLAFEDAAALAAALDEQPDLPAALREYEQGRRPAVESAQRSARASLEWFEDLERYLGQHPLQFGFNLLTRSRRVTDANLSLRDPAFAGRVRFWYAHNAPRVPRGAPRDDGRPPMFLPIQLRDLVIPNRVMVSPMAMYSATDGLIDDFHLVHLGSKALGGAGLVMTEMVAVAPDARITPRCAGLYRDEHEAAYRHLVSFIHRHSPAAAGIQLGHAGRKGATKVMWEGMDQPLEAGGWPLIAASADPYLPVSSMPRQMTRADMDRVVAQFAKAAASAARAGFDLLELHCAHGYLLSGFLTPLSNQRTDAYGGSLSNRLRFPLEVFDAVRAAWPGGHPISVRISATDWVPGALDGDDAVRIARAFSDHGADIIDVSTGQTSPLSKPSYGRSYQAPYADRIRHEAGVPTIAVGAISSSDDVNSLLLAGRADICALGRPFLYDPAWVLRAAAEQDYADAPWPTPYLPGRSAWGARPPDRSPPRGPRLDGGVRS